MIAWLIGGRHIVCLICGDEYTHRRTPVFPVNLAGYDQSCHDCGSLIVKGPWGVELFDRECAVCCGEALPV